MTTIELEDKLIDKVLKVGHYQNAQKAISSILSEYLQTHQKQKTPFDKLSTDLNMTDEEVDSLFARDKDTGRSLNL